MKTEPMQATGAEAVVQNLCRAYATAVNTSDSDAYSRLFAEDANRMPPGRPLEYGRQQI